MPTPRTLYARSGDIHLAYQVIGDGPRDVVLVLDWASHLEGVWEQPFIQEFTASVNRYARSSGSTCAGSGCPAGLIRFDDRGEHELKGVPDSWSLYATSGWALRGAVVRLGLALRTATSGLGNCNKSVTTWRGARRRVPARRTMAPRVDAASPHEARRPRAASCLRDAIAPGRRSRGT